MQFLADCSVHCLPQWLISLKSTFLKKKNLRKNSPEGVCEEKISINIDFILWGNLAMYPYTHLLWQYFFIFREHCCKLLLLCALKNLKTEFYSRSRTRVWTQIGLRKYSRESFIFYLIHMAKNVQTCDFVSCVRSANFVLCTLWSELKKIMNYCNIRL